MLKKFLFSTAILALLSNATFAMDNQDPSNFPKTECNGDTCKEYDDEGHLIMYTSPSEIKMYTPSYGYQELLFYASSIDQTVKIYSYKYLNDNTFHSYLVKELTYNPQNQENTLILYDDMGTVIFKGVHKGESLITKLSTGNLRDLATIQLPNAYLFEYFPGLKPHLNLTDIHEINERYESILKTMRELMAQGSSHAYIESYYFYLTGKELTYQAIVAKCYPDQKKPTINVPILNKKK